MFKIKHVEGCKFKLEKERGSFLVRDEITSRKQSTEKSSFKNIRDKFEQNVFQDYSHVKSSAKSEIIL